MGKGGLPEEKAFLQCSSAPHFSFFSCKYLVPLSLGLSRSDEQNLTQTQENEQMAGIGTKVSSEQLQSADLESSSL